MITGLCFISAGLSILVAVFVFSAISLENASSEALKSLTMMMGPGVVHKHRSLSYRLVYIFLALAIVLLCSGIYYWGQ